MHKDFDQNGSPLFRIHPHFKRLFLFMYVRTWEHVYNTIGVLLPTTQVNETVEGNFAIHAAVVQGYLPIVKLLIKYKADLNLAVCRSYCIVYIYVCTCTCTCMYNMYTYMYMYMLSYASREWLCLRENAVCVHECNSTDYHKRLLVQSQFDSSVLEPCNLF